MDRQIKVFAWNANGVLARKNELHFFATDYDADVILLSETHLMDTHRLALPGYHTYRTDRPPRRPGHRNPGGGTAVLVHRRLTHRQVMTPNNSVESTAIEIHCGGSAVTLVSAYSPPKVRFSAQDFSALLDLGDTVVVGGDLNAKHQTWNSRVNNAKGVSLRQYLDRRDDVTVSAPDQPTYYPEALRCRPDVLDIYLLKDLDLQTDSRAINELSSDHVPVLLTIHSTPVMRLPPGTGAIRTDWNMYNTLLATRLQIPQPATTPQELDDQVSRLQDALVAAAEEASSPAPPRNRKSSLPFHIREELLERRRLRRHFQLVRSPAAKGAFNRQNGIVRRLLDNHRSITWTNHLETLDIRDGTAWKTAKALRGTKQTSNPLHGRRGLVYSARDKCESFADTMEDQFQPNHAIFDDDTEEEVDDFMETFFEDPPDDGLDPFTPEEIRAVVIRAKVKKAPGIDKISTKAIHEAPPVLVDVLLSIYNAALTLHHFPATWKAAKIVLFNKPNKDPLFPQNYRPISLLPTLSKLFEKLILSRISPHLEDFIRPEQFGFRRGHSTTLQLIRVVNGLVDAANMGRSTVAVMLDVSKAFDKVWHQGLLYKLSISPLPISVVHLMKSYLTGRSFKISLDGHLSTSRPVEAGVPQGSVLGPVLYLVYTNDIPIIPRITLSLYADDALFTCISTQPANACHYLQRQMDVLSPWLEKWRIAVNTDKSEGIIFKTPVRRRGRRPRPQPIILNGAPISWKTSVKYLGVTLDPRLTFRKHMLNKAAEAKKIQGLMAPLLKRASPLPLAVKVTMFLMTVRSVVMYAAPAWWALLSNASKRVLEARQSTALRMITGQPWFVRNAVIRTSLQVPSLQEFAKSTAATLFQKLAHSPAAHLRELARREGAPEHHRLRPRAILDDPP